MSEMTGPTAVYLRVIQGSVRRGDPRGTYQRWLDDLSAGAPGWLGSTAGVSADGRFVAVEQYASEEGLRRAQDRPEQSRWWEELSDQLGGEPEVHESSKVATFTIGDLDDAAFVHVVQGRAADIDDVLVKIAETEESAALRDRAPILAGLVAAHDDDDGFTELTYFVSEEAAHEERDLASGSGLSRVEDLATGVTDLQSFRISDPIVASP